MDDKLNNYEKTYLLSLKGKLKHVEDAETKIIAAAYDLNIHQVTDMTKLDFVRNIYIKLTEEGIINNGKDIHKYLIETFTKIGFDANQTMVSDLTWLSADQLKKINAYECDHSFLI